MNEELTPLYKEGWVCPKCGRVLSPNTPECPCYYERKQTSVSSGNYVKVDYTHAISTTDGKIQNL